MKIFIRSSKQTSKCMALLLLSIGSIATMSTTQAATNLVLRNPKFTSNPTITTNPPGWTISNPNLVTWSTTGGYDNSGAIKLSDPGPNVSAVAESEQVAVKAGAQIDVSAQVKLQNNTDPATVMVAIKFYAGTTALPIATSMGAVGNNDQWLLTKLSVIAPAGATKASVVLFTANAAPATAYFDNITFTTPEIQDKGDQITRSLVSAAAFDGDVLYVGATGFPAKFAAYDISNGERRFEVELPKTEEILSVAVATDRTVYIGTASGRLYQHAYGSTTVKLVGTSSSEAIWTLKPGSNGSMYGGGSKDAAAFHFTPSDSKMYPIPGPLSTAKNVRSLAVDKIGEKIYWGLGTSAASYQTDLSGNNPKDLLGGVAKGTNWDYTYYTDYVGGKVFARITGSLLNQTLVLDPSTPTAKPPIIDQINSFGISGLAPAVAPATQGDLVFYTKPDPTHINKASHLYSYSIKGGTEDKITPMSQSAAFMFTDNNEVIACVREGEAGYGWIVKHNYRSNSTSPVVRFKSPVVATGLRTLTVGPGANPKVFTAGFLDGGLATFDPAATTPATLKNEADQAEGLAVLDDKLYAGLYQYAKIASFDVTTTGLENKKELFNLSGTHKQDRPFAMLAIPAPVNKLVVGTVPQYAVNASGSLAILSLDEASVPAVPVITDNFIAGQSILALTNIGNVIYGGTSTWGAYNDKPVKDANGVYETATLFSLDISNPKAVPTLINPVKDRLVISTLINVQGKIWGLAEDTLFIYDPANPLGVIQQKDLFGYRYSEWNIAWKAAKMVEAKNGYVYISFDDKLYRVSIKTPGQRPELVISSGVNSVDIDETGNLYYISGARLKKFDMVANPQ